MEFNKIGIRVYKNRDYYINIANGERDNCIYSDNIYKCRYINDNMFGIRIWK
jgi:hypothetical protein